MNKGSFKKNYTPWDKGKIGFLKHSQKTKEQMGLKRRGKKLTIQHRLNISKAVPKGEKHKSWKGGAWQRNKIVRGSVQYRIWRSLVKERDKKCVQCGSGEDLQVDHIKSFSKYPELRFDVSNGRVLCFECHKKTDTWGGFSRKELNTTKKNR